MPCVVTLNGGRYLVQKLIKGRPCAETPVSQAMATGAVRVALEGGSARARRHGYQVDVLTESQAAILVDWSTPGGQP